MATVIISAGQAGGGSIGIPPAAYAVPRAAQSITSSGSNQVSTVIGRLGEIVSVYSSGGAVKVACAEGADPNATSVVHHIVSDGGALNIYCQRDDTRIAVVDV